MSKAVERGGKGLTQAFVNNAVSGRHSDGRGLALVVKTSGQGSWEWRGQSRGKRYEIGLGSSKVIKLERARQLAARAATALAEGEDPRVALGKATGRIKDKDFTLSAVVSRCFESRKAVLKEGGKAGRWMAPLEGHVLPILGDEPVDEIDAEAIRAALAPIWHEKPATAIKAFNCLKMALIYAADEGAEVDEAAPLRAKRLLGPQADISKRIPATAYGDVPALYARLCGLSQTPAALALRLTILTCQRLKPVRTAQLSQFDLEAGLWIIPGEAMKGQVGKTEDFRCPLSEEAKRVVEIAARLRRGDDLFPAQRGAGFVSDRGIEKLLDKLEERGRPHGFRSSFGDWAGATGVPFDVAERCLQHAVGNKVAQAYRRDDQLEVRRKVLGDWATHVTSARDDEQRSNLRVVE